MKRALLGVLAIGLLAGCSSVNVTTDYDVAADFSKFKTFKYVDSDNSLERKSQLAHSRVVAAVRQGMTSSGLTEVEDNPDVFVTYHSSTEQQQQFTTTYSGVSGWGRSRYMGMGISSSTTRSTTITEGTLIIDVWNADTNSLAWRGMATATLSRNPEKNSAKISRAVERAFNDFPPN